MSGSPNSSTVVTIAWWILGLFIGVLIAISVLIGISEGRGIKGVCIRCGFLKRKLLKACPCCKFVPSLDEEMAKAFMLSTREHHVGEIFPGKPLSELRRISKRIESGKAYEFDASELQKVLRNL